MGIKRIEDILYAMVAKVTYTDSEDKQEKAAIVAFKNEVKIGDFFICNGVILQAIVLGYYHDADIWWIQAECTDHNNDNYDQAPLLLCFVEEK